MSDVKVISCSQYNAVTTIFDFFGFFVFLIFFWGVFFFFLFFFSLPFFCFLFFFFLGGNWVGEETSSLTPMTPGLRVGSPLRLDFISAGAAPARAEMTWKWCAGKDPNNICPRLAICASHLCIRPLPIQTIAITRPHR